MRDEISIVVIDDHELFRAGVIQALQLDGDISVVAEGATAVEAVDLVGEHQPDVALIDISIPGNGISAAADIVSSRGRTKVVMLTVSEDDDDIVRSLEQGATGYILKGIGANDLIAAVRSVAAGESFVSPNLALRLLSGMRAKSKATLLARLSPQERKTLRLVATGLSNREVGAKLGILEKTVKYHMTNIMVKLEVRNRVEATLLAQREWKLIEDD